MNEYCQFRKTQLKIYIYPNIYTDKYTYRLKLLSGEVEQEEDWEIYKLKGIHILVQTIEI